MSAAELRYLTEVDGHDHIALVAVLADDPESIVAVARCVRFPDTPDTAEFAIVVGDPLQGRGLGSLLARELAAAARAAGIRRFSATMLGENVAVRRLIAHFTRTLEHDHIEHGVREVVVDTGGLAGVAVRLPRGAYAGELGLADQRYRSLVEQVPAVSYVARWEPGSPFAYVSPQIEDLLGFPAERWVAEPELWAERLHPDDREGVLLEELRTLRRADRLRPRVPPDRRRRLAWSGCGSATRSSTTPTASPPTPRA